MFIGVSGDTEKAPLISERGLLCQEESYSDNRDYRTRWFAPAELFLKC
jgi:hypothetical protein